MPNEHTDDRSEDHLKIAGVRLFRVYLVKYQSREKAEQPPAKHLPGRPRPLSLKKITHEAGERTDQEACLRPKRHPCNDHKRSPRLERDKQIGEEIAADGERGHHRDDDDFPRPGPPLFKHKKKG